MLVHLIIILLTLLKLNFSNKYQEANNSVREVIRGKSRCILKFTSYVIPNKIIYTVGLLAKYILIRRYTFKPIVINPAKIFGTKEGLLPEISAGISSFLYFPNIPKTLSNF